MKKLFCLLLCALLLLSGCANNDGFEPDYITLSGTEPATDEEVLAYRRDVVEAQMRFMSSVLWTPTSDITYSMKNGSLGAEADAEENENNVVTLYAGNIYQGIPYTHGGGSGYSFLSYATEVDENGVYTLDGLTTHHVNGLSRNKINTCSRIGNDCADCVFWAWSQVSSSISFGSTNFMTEHYGCLKVGDYDFEGTNYSGTNTKTVCKDNGEQRMFECYAQMQKGDGMVLITKSGAGHAVMTVSVHVERNSDGEIDGEKSYAVILEQTSSHERNMTNYYNEEIGETVYICEELDKQWTFDTLFSKGYLPITCKELVDPSPLPEPTVTDCVDEPTKDNLFTGVIKSNYRISSVTVTITDWKGETVQQATCYGLQSEMYTLNLYRFLSDVEQLVMQGSINVDDLDSGSYHCTFTARLSTGDNITFRDFDFKV